MFRDDCLYVSYNTEVVKGVGDLGIVDYKGYDLIIWVWQIVEFLKADENYSNYDISEIKQQIEVKRQTFKREHQMFYEIEVGDREDFLKIKTIHVIGEVKMRVEYDAQGNAKLIRSEFNEQPDENRKNPSKFYDIPYLQTKVLDTFEPTDEVWIEEKIDGTNVSCEIDDNDEFKCYGRRYELGTWYTNRGAYQQLLELEDTVRTLLPPEFKLYFEYLTLHHVRYSADKENKLYLIGVKNKVDDKYLIPSGVYQIAKLIGVETPACLYHGLFRDWSIAQSLVGKSEFGAKQGEGVIVKGRDNKHGIKMVKIVADDFREIMKYDATRVQAKLDDELRKREKAKEIVTEARIRKQLYNMRDEGIIGEVEGMTTEDKVVAIKNIGRRIYDDCIKEELDFVLEFGKDFGKYSFILSKIYINSL